MSTEYILSQIFIVINYLLLGVTYLVKSRKQILIYNYASLIANAISYFFLSAWSGLAMCGVALLRNIILSVQNHFKILDNSKIIDWAIFVFLVIISAISAYFTYEGLLSLFSVFGTFIYTISIWQKNQIAYKFLGIVCSVCWIVYNIFVWSIFGFSLEIVLLIIEIVGVVLALINLKKSRAYEFQKNIKFFKVVNILIEDNKKTK